MKRGITLLETLIAILVLTVGLLGLASLLPVSRFFMADGSKYDHTATLGQQAIHYLESRKDLLNPEEWYAPGGNGNFIQVCPPPGVGNSNTTQAAYNYQWPTLSPIQTIPAAPFILDPLACAWPTNLQQNGTPGAASGTGQIGVAGNYSPTFFPPSGYSLDSPGGIGAIGSPALARVTVPRSGSLSMVGGNSLFCKPMAFGMAQSVFVSSDDPVFALPDDPSQRPIVALPNSANPSQWSKTAGDYSWFAIIDNMQKPWNPGPDGGWGVAGADDNADGLKDNASEQGWPGSDDIALWKQSGAELWEVSVVVCYKRNLQLIPGSVDETPPERMCYCDFLSSPLPPPAGYVDASGNPKSGFSGLGGGDCVLYFPSTLPSGAPTPKEWLNVKPNQWVMLSGWLSDSPNLATPVRGQLASIQWFRLSAVGEIEQTSTGWQRAVTLSGADMDPYKFVDAVGAPGGNQSLYCTIVDGVTGVFEATIEQGQSN